MRALLCGCCAPGRRGVLKALSAGALLATGMAPRPAPAQPATRVVNTHAHYFPEGFLDLMAAEGGRFGAGYERDGDVFYTIGAGQKLGPLPMRFIDLPQRIADMDAQGVHVQAMSLTAPMVYWADDDLSERLARAWNDGASEAHRRYPDRLYGLMALPMLNTDRALRELERARGLPGIRGVYLGTNIAGKDLSDPRFLPVFEAAERLRLPVFLHPLNTVGGERLQPWYLSNLIGNPVDTAIAAAHLIMGGVLDRCPTLEVNLPHAGGVLPILTGRWDRGAAQRPELRHLAHLPSDYRRRFTYDTVAHSAAVMRFVIAQAGPDRVTLGDDYCYDMGEENPVGAVDALDLNPADRALLLGGTASRLLGI